ncbi:hypothetical protein ES703_61464 [subsurface metagenome]
MEIVCSAAEMVFPPGVFITIIPLLVAEVMSILSRPVPALPITLRREAAPITSPVTLVSDLTIKASYSGIVLISSSCDNPGASLTLILSSSFNLSTPSLAKGSLIKTFTHYLHIHSFSTSSAAAIPFPDTTG